MYRDPLGSFVSGLRFSGDGGGERDRFPGESICEAVFDTGLLCR